MILITTYNRPRLLLRLLSQIDRQREDTVLVVDDGTPQEIEFEQYERIKVLYYRRDYNKGKKKYYPFLAYEDRVMDDKFKESIMKAIDEHMHKLAQAQTEIKVREEPLGEFPF